VVVSGTVLGKNLGYRRYALFGFNTDGTAAFNWVDDQELIFTHEKAPIGLTASADGTLIVVTPENRLLLISKNGKLLNTFNDVRPVWPALLDSGTLVVAVDNNRLVWTLMVSDGLAAGWPRQRGSNRLDGRSP
jgi:hypothetical protein